MFGDSIWLLLFLRRQVKHGHFGGQALGSIKITRVFLAGHKISLGDLVSGEF